MKRSIVVVLLAFLALTISVSGYIWISNIIGPYKIHVRGKTAQLLELEAIKTPPSEVSLGSTVNITMRVRNPSQETVKGYLVVNITASDFTPKGSDLSVKGVTDGWFGHTSGWFCCSCLETSKGLICTSYQNIELTWAPGCDETAFLYITFNKPNPTDQGYYEISVGISSTPS
ncbi:MAG: hypothetical protein ACP5LQ_08855 [Candidatus Methanodesulfokora sp.]